MISTTLTQFGEICGNAKAINGDVVRFSIECQRRLLKISAGEVITEMSFMDATFASFKRKISDGATEAWFDGFFSRMFRSGKEYPFMEMMACIDHPAFEKLSAWLEASGCKDVEVIRYVTARNIDASAVNESDLEDLRYINLDKLIEYAQLHPEVMELINQVKEAYVAFKRDLHEDHSNILPIERHFREDVNKVVEFLDRVTITSRFVYIKSSDDYNDEDPNDLVSVHDLREIGERYEVLLCHPRYAVLVNLVVPYESRYFKVDVARCRFEEGGVITKVRTGDVGLKNTGSMSIDFLPPTIVDLIQKKGSHNNVIAVEMGVGLRGFRPALRDLITFCGMQFV